MRITIEPTSTMVEHGQHTVRVEHPSDELNLDEVIHLVSSAIVCYGFSKAGVQEYFEGLANG